MNAKHISLAFAAAAALLAGCAKNPIEETKSSGQLTDLELSHVGSTEVKSVINGTDFPQTGEIGLFLFEDETATKAYGDGYPNVKYSYNSTKGRWTASPSIKVGSTPGYLYGYYPYDSEATDVKAIPVESSLNGNDVMYASKQAEPITDATAANTAITMNHALARVSITIVNKGYTGDAKLSKIKFYGAEIAPTGTLNAIDGSITAEKDEVSLDVTDEAQTITAAGSTYECLLVPSKVETNRQAVTLTLTIDDIVKEATLSGDDNGVIIARNTKSNITIGLSNSGISVQTVSVEDWQTVQVGGHKVTVKLSDDAGIEDDVYLNATSDESTVTIKALAAITGRLTSCTCTPAGKATCTPSIDEETGICTFTISNVQEDITAEVGYLKHNVTAVFDSDMGAVKLNGAAATSGIPVQILHGEDAEFTAEANTDYRFLMWTDGSDKDLSTDNPYTISSVTSDITLRAVFGLKDAIGVFTVAVDEKGTPTKRVQFSKGNLYCSGVEFNDDGTVKSMGNAQWRFETNQYDTTPHINDARIDDHISHFMWCNTAEKAMALKYDFSWDGESPFFAAKDFTVNGFSVWRVLTGDTDGEWEYLLDKRETTYDENRRYAAVKVNGMAGLLIFPDDFSSWPSGAGDEPQTFNTRSDSWNGRNYTAAEFTVLQDNGCVFLPAAGYRVGYLYHGDPSVSSVGISGGYWSASPDGSYTACYLSVIQGSFKPGAATERHRAYSIRLVTDIN